MHQFSILFILLFILLVPRNLLEHAYFSVPVDFAVDTVKQTRIAWVLLNTAWMNQFLFSRGPITIPWSNRSDSASTLSNVIDINTVSGIWDLECAYVKHDPNFLWERKEISIFRNVWRETKSLADLINGIHGTIIWCTLNRCYESKAVPN